MRWVIGLLVLAGAGCATRPAPDCAGQYRAHTSLTDAQRVSVEAAFAGWNAFLGREAVRFDTHESDDTTCSVRAVAKGSAEWEQLRGEDESIAGAHVPEDGSLVIVPEELTCSFGDCVQDATMHELGHALGLRHVDGGGVMRSAMRRRQPAVVSFTAADRLECLRAGACVNSGEDR